MRDHRLVVLAAAERSAVMAPATPAEMAEQLARTGSLGTERFNWFKVNKAAGPSSNEGQELAQPLQE